mgnify:FL=1
MNRKHTIKEYLTTYDKLKKLNPAIEFSSDFIIGYPEEDEMDFKATLDLIKKIGFVNSYSFIFSPRPGTVASKLKLTDQKISLKRLEIIQKELFKNQIMINRSFEKRIVDVLVEKKTEENNKFFGRSEYMTSVIFDANDEDVGKIVKVKIKKSNQKTLFGEIVDKVRLRVA